MAYVLLAGSVFEQWEVKVWPVDLYCGHLNLLVFGVSFVISCD
jgi:hypothetical protein